MKSENICSVDYDIYNEFQHMDFIFSLKKDWLSYYIFYMNAWILR